MLVITRGALMTKGRIPVAGTRLELSDAEGARAIARGMADPVPPVVEVVQEAPPEPEPQPVIEEIVAVPEAPVEVPDAPKPKRPRRASSKKKAKK